MSWIFSTEINFHGRRSGQGVWPMKTDFRGYLADAIAVRIFLC